MADTSAPNPLRIHCADCSVEAPCERCAEQIEAERSWVADREPIDRTRQERARDEMPTDTYESLLALVLNGEAA